MKLTSLKSLLGRNAESSLRFVLPDGRAVPEDFHVTEVGHVIKRSVDCGGTGRTAESCLLQVWLAANDKDHRMTAGKLGSILEIANPLFTDSDPEVEIEYEDAAISQYPVASVEERPGALSFMLAHKHTDCLAREACGLETECCGTSGCC